MKSLIELARDGYEIDIKVEKASGALAFGIGRGRFHARSLVSESDHSDDAFLALAERLIQKYEKGSAKHGHKT